MNEPLTHTESGIPLYHNDWWCLDNSPSVQILGFNGDKFITSNGCSYCAYPIAILKQPLTFQSQQLDHEKYVYKYPGVAVPEGVSWPEMLNTRNVWVGRLEKSTAVTKCFYRCLRSEYCESCEHPKSCCGDDCPTKWREIPYKERVLYEVPDCKARVPGYPKLDADHWWHNADHWWHKKYLTVEIPADTVLVPKPKDGCRMVPLEEREQTQAPDTLFVWHDSKWNEKFMHPVAWASATRAVCIPESTELEPIEPERTLTTCCPKCDSKITYTTDEVKDWIQCFDCRYSWDTTEQPVQPANLPEGFKAYRLAWSIAGTPLFCRPEYSDKVTPDEIEWHGHDGMSQCGFMYTDDYRKDMYCGPSTSDPLPTHSYMSDREKPAKWIVFREVK